MRRTILATATACALLASTALLTAAAQPKVRVCHGASTGLGHVVEVAQSALADHFSHGDTETTLPKGAACTADEWQPQ